MCVCVCVFIIGARKRVIVLSLFSFAAIFILISLQKFLSNMESHRQRGHRMFENMRKKHLQVGLQKYISWLGENEIRCNMCLCLMYPCVCPHPSYVPQSGIMWAPSGFVSRLSCWGRELYLAQVQGCCWAKIGCKTLQKVPIGPDYASAEKHWGDPKR